MKLSICIAAFLAGIVSFCAHAASIESDVTFENDAVLIVIPTESYGLHGFERTEIRRSGIAIGGVDVEINEPAIVVEPVVLMEFLPQVPVPQTVFVEPIVPDPMELVAPFVPPQAVFVEPIVPDPVELIAPLALTPASMSAAPRATPVIVMFSEFPDARVPEPASLLLFGSGLLMLASRRLFRA